MTDKRKRAAPREAQSSSKAAFGIAGLDDILKGGLPRKRLYLIQGDPGVGKTTLGIQFLLEGAKRGERALYITLSETQEEITFVAQSHGWSLDRLHIHEHRINDLLKYESHQTVFHPSEIELTETTEALIDVIERVKPERLVLDSLSEFRLLSGSALRYRRQILALKQYFSGLNCTVLLIDDRTAGDNDIQLQSLAHGVVSLEAQTLSFGPDRLRMRVVKLRGMSFTGGFHDYRILTGGIQVYPRLVAAEHRHTFPPSLASSGNKDLDELLGGGLDRGGSTLFLGPAGTGKSTIVTQYAVAAAARGEKVSLYAFDEGLHMLFARAAGLNIDLERHVKSGMIKVREIDPAELTPGEFSHIICRTVEEDDTRMVIIDSLTGYLNAMPEDRILPLVLHELLAFLNQRQVASLIVAAQHGILGSAMKTEMDVSYLADTVVLFRYYEFNGEIKQALSVFKRRSGSHRRTIHELKLSSKKGISIGEPLTQFQGILTGVPNYENDKKPEKNRRTV